MLKQRVITALILVAILLPTLWVEALWPFALLSLLFVAAAGWEWARLNEAPGVPAWGLGAAVAGTGLLLAGQWGLPVWQALPEGQSASQGHVHALTETLVGFTVPAPLWWGAALVWLLGGAMALRHGSQHWRAVPMALRAVLGLALLVVAWLALAEAKLQGLNFLLSILCLVWAADIGAYFGGRAFGRRKLAPSISPGKSWEGVLAGALAVQALAALWLWVDAHVGVDSPSLYSHLRQGLGAPGMVLAVLALTGMSVVGDLFESLIKRQAGAKDSSQLLPGHGGVLDRIDALLPVLPLSMALMSLCHGW
ncbi:MAG TPA: phosphatidate cytidylyltransferase [Aquabacterium sp.]|uniref:phosphatidate cytidylyltransferase n=1 Tax=Aquabacterium sp. TaxID=1872578 RepID=UPI002E35DCEB|nr:phosphatidate cytidylyltransferase [Aquabacterium sp.]HEX5374466.1 phosphatidate cytidylyltransferase [Aquabacterium sp.]